MCKPEEYVDLGLRMISLGNCALLGKWLCRFLGENFGLWHQVFLSIYEIHYDGYTTL